MTTWCLIPNLVLYFLASLFYLFLPFGESFFLQERRRFWLADIAFLLTLFGALLELIYLGFSISQKTFSPLAFVSLGLIFLFLWLVWRGGWWGLGIIFVPLGFIFLILSLEGQSKSYLLEKLSWLISFHIVFAGLALIFLLGSFCLGLAFLIHERNLKTKKWGHFAISLPPLLPSERKAAVWLRIGFVWLTLVLITGSLLVFEHPHLFSKEFMHIALALAAWGFYAAGLNRRWLAPQGRKILLLSLLGFVSLGVAYLWT